MSTGDVYRVAKWRETFETADSRKHQKLRWVSTPIGFESNGYALLIEHFNEEAPAIYGAWSAVVQIAAQGPPNRRGLLCDSKGVGYTVGRLQFLSHFPSTVFAKLIEWAVGQDVGWLEIIPKNDVQNLLTGTDPVANQSPTSHELGYTTEPNLTEHNTTKPNPCCSSSVVDFCFVCSWEELTEKGARLRKMIQRNERAVSSSTLLEMVAFDLASGTSFSLDLGGRLRDGEIRKPGQYISAAFRQSCEEKGTTWSEVQPKLAERISQIKGMAKAA